MDFEFLKKLCMDSYSNNTNLDYITSDIIEESSGLFMILINNKGQTYLVIRGTELSDKDDFIADLSLLTRHLPTQAAQALSYFNSIKNKYPNLIVTGHSLGGSIAQIIGTKQGNKTVTFSAFGSEGSCKRQKENNIINFGMERDTIFTNRIEAQIGKTYIIPSNKPKFISNHKIDYKLLKKFITKSLGNFIVEHKLENYNSLSSGILFDRSKLYETYEILNNLTNKCLED